MRRSLIPGIRRRNQLAERGVLNNLLFEPCLKFQELNRGEGRPHHVENVLGVALISFLT